LKKKKLKKNKIMGGWNPSSGEGILEFGKFF
jgi:hypothetical protein